MIRSVITIGTAKTGLFILQNGNMACILTILPYMLIGLDYMCHYHICAQIIN